MMLPPSLTLFTDISEIGMKWESQRYINVTQSFTAIGEPFQRSKWTDTSKHRSKHTNKKRKPVVFSPQANYTDWAIDNGRRNLVPTFSDRGVPRDQGNGSPPPLNSIFYTEAATLHSSSTSVILMRMRGPRSRPTASQRNVVATGIEHGTTMSVARNTHH
jgi:hypothetical protein